MKKIFLIFMLVLSFSKLLFAQVVPQGYLIGPQAIGGQIWALSNLSTSTYANGDAIPYYTSASTFAGLTTPASCSINFNSANDAVYGRLYNWYAVNESRNICPVSWHVPVSTDFVTLSSTIGGDGNALKETGYGHWSYGGGTDKYNFKAVGAGYMGSASYSHLYQSTYFWTNSEVALGSSNAYTWPLIDNSSSFAQSSQGKLGGFSVRCIHD
jgi:uncharacterized protein (TIGR02145 family)